MQFGASQKDGFNVSIWCKEIGYICKSKEKMAMMVFVSIPVSLVLKQRIASSTVRMIANCCFEH